MPTQAISALHSYLLDGKVPHESLGIQFQHHKPVPLLEYQASKGFADLPDRTLKRLMDELKLPSPVCDEDESGIEYELMMAIDLVNHYMPKLSLDEIRTIAHSRADKERQFLENALEHVIDDDTMEELMPAGETKNNARASSITT